MVSTKSSALKMIWSKTLTNSVTGENGITLPLISTGLCSSGWEYQLALEWNICSFVSLEMSRRAFLEKTQLSSSRKERWNKSLLTNTVSSAYPIPELPRFPSLIPSWDSSANWSWSLPQILDRSELFSLSIYLRNFLDFSLMLRGDYIHPAKPTVAVRTFYTSVWI